MPTPSIDDFWNLGFRVEFLLPSSGIFSNITIKIIQFIKFDCLKFPWRRKRKFSRNIWNFFWGWN